MTTTPDNSGRVAEIKATNAGNVFSDFAYSYASSGADAALTQTRTDHTTGAITNYAYDALNRLTQAMEATGSSTTASWLYCYDNDGNRTGTSTISGATCSSPSTSYQYNGADQLTGINGNSNGWSYDANGNETAGLGTTARTNESYSVSDQLMGLTANNAPITFAYAGLTNTERVAAGSTSYQNGEEGLASQSANRSTASFTSDPSGTLVSERVGGQSYYYLFDGLGSVVGLVDATGHKVDNYSYDPYGQARTTNEQVANPFRYASGYLDTSTGLYHFGARYYDPSLARWTQLDPASISLGYSYADDNPINEVDPSGRISIRAIGDYISGDYCDAILEEIQKAAKEIDQRVKQQIRNKSGDTLGSKDDAGHLEQFR